MRKVLFLRKKLAGQNSMEGIASSLAAEIQGLEIVELPYYSTSFIGMIKNGLYARKYQGDINHIFSITEGYLSLFIKGKKLVTVHDLYFHHLSVIGRIGAWLLWIILPSLLVDRYICISHVTKKSLLKYIPWAKRKTDVIHNPINNKFFKEYVPVKNTKPIILHIGTALHKNLDKVISALKDIECKLIIIGKLFPEQIKLLADLNIDYSNYYDVDLESLVEFYKQSDIVTFPSSQEGFGMIVIEANAMRTPILAGDIPVLHEVGEEAALYVNPTDINEINNSLKLLLNNLDLRESLINRGVFNAKKYSINKIISQYSTEYNRLKMKK